MQCNESKVVQIQCLDEHGYWTGRTLFINCDTFEELQKHIQKLIQKGEIIDSYTTVREVKFS